MKRFLFLVLCFLSVPFYSRAAILVQQNNYNDDTNSAGYQSFLPGWNYTVDGFGVRTNKDPFATTTLRTLRVYVESYTSFTGEECNTGMVLVASSTITDQDTFHLGDEKVNYVPLTPFTMNPALCYRFNMIMGGPGSAAWWGHTANQLASTSAQTGVGVADMYFFLTGGTAGSDTILTTFPTDGATTTDFSHFTVDYSTAGTSPTSSDIAIYSYYGDFEDYRYVPSSNNGTTTFQIIKQNDLAPGPYTVRFGLKIGETFVATSTDRLFSVVEGAKINNFDPTEFQLPFTDASSTLQDCSWTEVSGCLINAGVYLGRFFFVPSTGTLLVLKQDVLNFKNVFPFNVFFTTADTVLGSVSGAPTNPDLNLTFHLNGSSTLVLPIAGSTTLLGIMDESAKNTLFEYQGYLIYGATVAAIIAFIL